jgi:channel protein (hemolysin III family)
MPTSDDLIVRSVPGFADPVASWLHLAGSAAFVWLGARLLRRGRGSTARVAALAIYAAASVQMLGVSGVYHMLPRESAVRLVLQRLDHAAIFLLIAGTFTPPHVILLRGLARWGVLVPIWAAALTGLVFKVRFFEFFANEGEWLGLMFYLVLGWSGAVSAVVLARRFGWGLIEPLFWGAVVITFGAVCEFLRRPVLLPGVVGPHELWHLCVVVGMLFHWRFIEQFASGMAPAGTATAGSIAARTATRRRRS